MNKQLILVLLVSAQLFYAQKDTPSVMDKKEELPITSDNFNRLLDKQEIYYVNKYKERINLPKERNLDPKIQKAIRTEVEKDLNKKMKYGFTYEKYYRYENDIKNGHGSIDNWLNYELEEKTFNELEFYETFDGNVHGESMAGFQLAMDNLVKSKFNIPAKAKTEWLHYVKDSSNSKNQYWAVESAYLNESLTESVILLSLEKKNSDWKFSNTTFNEKYLIEFDKLGENSNSNNFSLYIQSQNKTKGKFIALDNEKIGVSYIGNSDISETNFIRTEDGNPKEFDVTLYYDAVQDSDEVVMDRYFITANFKPFFYYNDSLLKKLNLSYILSDKKLYNKVNEYEVNLSIIDEKANKKRQFEDEESVLYIAKKILADVPFSPVKRIYKTGLIFGDINNNGIQDCYNFSISNGKLITYKVYELTDIGVVELSSNEIISKKITMTTLFKKIQGKSLLKEDKEEFDPYRLVRKDDPAPKF